MKVKFIVSFVALAAVLVYLGFTAKEWGTNTIGYANFEEAQRTGKLSYIKGSWVKDKEVSSTLHAFIFYMQDEKGNVVKVKYGNGKPNNFEQATSVVVQGKFENGEFIAKDMLVKCPSKYQSDGGKQI
jgi:cytochrome c-type biogenesis protein CcmE